MEFLTNPDWQDMFSLDTPVLEIFIRGTCMYLGLFLILRIVLKRISGTISVSDLLMVVLIADAAQNGMANEYHSITDGLILVSTLIFWNIVLDFLGFHVPFINRIIHPPPLPLIENGRLIHKNMRRELITKGELMSHLREQGLQSIEEVKKAFMEGDGRISICAYEDKQQPDDERRGI